MAFCTNYDEDKIENIEIDIEKNRIEAYNMFCRRNPIRQDLLTVLTPAVMSTFTYRHLCRVYERGYAYEK